jgi:RNA polymerase sigma-70 factor (ECF subfamily)
MKDDSAKTDGDIINLVRLGETDLFSILIGRYEEKIKRYARKFLSDGEDINDVVQDIFIKVFVNIKSFDLKRKFSTWLYRIAHNELVNHLKKRKKMPLPLIDMDILFPYYISKNEAGEEMDRRDFSKKIESCVNELDWKYREPIFLYYMEDLSYKEISEILQVPVSTVGVRMKRAKETLKSSCKGLKEIYG